MAMRKNELSRKNPAIKILIAVLIVVALLVVFFNFKWTRYVYVEKEPKAIVTEDLFVEENFIGYLKKRGDSNSLLPSF